MLSKPLSVSGHISRRVTTAHFSDHSSYCFLEELTKSSEALSSGLCGCILRIKIQHRDAQRRRQRTPTGHQVRPARHPTTPLPAQPTHSLSGLFADHPGNLWTSSEDHISDDHSHLNFALLSDDGDRDRQTMDIGCKSRVSPFQRHKNKYVWSNW